PEELDAHRSQASELPEHASVLLERQLRVLAVGTVAVPAACIARVQQRVLDEERTRHRPELGGGDARADAQLVARGQASPRFGHAPPAILGRDAVWREKG